MKTENVEKIVANLHDKTEYIIHIKNLKQALNHGFVLKKVHKVIKFNKMLDFEKYFFRLMNIAVFGKTMENDRKHRDLKLSLKVFHRQCITNRNKKKRDN